MLSTLSTVLRVFNQLIYIILLLTSCQRRTRYNVEC